MKTQPVKLKNITDKITKGTTPTTMGFDFIDYGINFIKAEALNGDSELDNQGFAYINDDAHNRLKRSILQKNDVLVTIAGVNIGKVGIVKQKYLPANTNQAVGIVRINPDLANSNYVYYWFKNPLTFNHLQNINSQAAQPNINLEMLGNLSLLLPDIQTQQRIASNIIVYDELINTNRRRIQLLEEAARLLFREWFVYFRFPGHEKVKIVDGVPEGWEKGNIYNISEVKSGYAFNSKDWLDEGNPVIKIGNIIGDGTINLDDCSYIDQSVASKAKSFTLKKGDLLIAMTGATIGKVGLLSENEKIAYLNQRVGKFIPKFEGAELILYCFFMGNTAQNHIMNYAGGAAQANISASQIESIKILVAPQDIYNQFIGLIEPMFEEILNLRSQNQKLAQARDLLLPRLMSGEIGV